MASVTQEIHTWINAQPWVPGVINFNTVRPDAADPWYLMAVTDADNERPLLCYSAGGILTLSFSGFGSERYDTYTIMDELRQNIFENMRNAIPNYEVWNVISDGAVSTESIDNQMSEYTFDIMASWGKE